MDPKHDEGILLEYYTINSRAYRVFNNRTTYIMEYINVIVDEIQISDVTEEEEESTISEQNITPDVSNKGTNIILSPEE